MKKEFYCPIFRPTILMLAVFFIAMLPVRSQTILTIAGHGGAGYNGEGIPATSAQIFDPYNSVVDASGNIYFVEYGNMRARKVNTSGVITTIAGTGTPSASGDGGPATAASLLRPFSIALDNSGNIYIGGISDIRKINTYGVISTVAGVGSAAGYSGDGGYAVAASVNCVWGITIDPSGNIYFSDRENSRIRKISTSGIISTVAGRGSPYFSGDGGAATAAYVNRPVGIAINSSGEIIFADAGNYRVRKISTSGIITTIAGHSNGFSGDGGSATAAQMGQPLGLCIDAADNIYVSDPDNIRIRKINTSGIITTFAGNGSRGYGGDGIAATAATLSNGESVSVDGSGNLYITELVCNRIRKVNTSGIISTIAGMGHTGFSGDGGPAINGQFFNLRGMVLDTFGNTFILDAWNNRVRKINSSGILSTIAGTGIGGVSGDGGPATAAQFVIPWAISLDNIGNIYVADLSNHVRKIDTSGVVNTMAGAGTSASDGIPATSAALSQPVGLATDNSNNVYIVEQGNHKIRKINSSGIITTIAGTGTAGYSGDGGPATAAKLDNPGVICVSAGNIYIFDANNYRIRMINSSGIIRSIAGIGVSGYSGDGGPATAAQIKGVGGFAFDATGNMYFSDPASHKIRKISTSGIISTIAGTGVYGWTGDGGLATAAQIFGPMSIAVDTSGNILFADMMNDCIREIYHCVIPSVGAISGVDSLCAGTSITLSDTSTMGAWGSSSPSNATVNSTTGVVTGMLAGALNISYTVTNSCATTTSTHTLVVNPAPFAASIHGTDTLCPGHTTTLTDTATGGTWVSSNTSIATVSSTGVVTSIAPGTVNMLYIITNSCGSDTATFPFTVRTPGACNTGVNTVDNGHSLALFPNPNKGSFTLNLSSGSNEEVHIIVTNILGEKIKHMKTTTNKETVVQLNVPSGIYFVSAATANEQYMEKIVVE